MGHNPGAVHRLMPGAHLVLTHALTLAGHEGRVIGPVLVAGHTILLQQPVQHEHLCSARARLLPETSWAV